MGNTLPRLSEEAIPCLCEHKAKKNRSGTPGTLPIGIRQLPRVAPGGWTAVGTASSAESKERKHSISQIARFLQAASSNSVSTVMRMMSESEDGSDPVSVHLCDVMGNTALHGAAINGHMSMVRVLMTLGAEDVANKQGKTPSNLADEAGHMECAAMIAMYRNNTSTSDAPPRRGMVSQHQARPVVLQGLPIIQEGPPGCERTGSGNNTESPTRASRAPTRLAPPRRRSLTNWEVESPRSPDEGGSPGGMRDDSALSGDRTRETSPVTPTEGIPSAPAFAWQVHPTMPQVLAHTKTTRCRITSHQAAAGRVDDGGGKTVVRDVVRGGAASEEAVRARISEAAALLAQRRASIGQVVIGQEGQGGSWA